MPGLTFEIVPDRSRSNIWNARRSPPGPPAILLLIFSRIILVAWEVFTPLTLRVTFRSSAPPLPKYFRNSGHDIEPEPSWSILDHTISKCRSSKIMLTLKRAFLSWAARDGVIQGGARGGACGRRGVRPCGRDCAELRLCTPHWRRGHLSHLCLHE